MATTKRSGNRGGNRRSRNNNPEGRNQYSGIIGTARSNPLAAAAAVGGAVAAGVFLWARRDQISDQIGALAEQISDRRESFMAGSGSEAGSDGRTQAEIAQEALTLKELGEPA